MIDLYVVRVLTPALEGVDADPKEKDRSQPMSLVAANAYAARLVGNATRGGWSCVRDGVGWTCTNLADGRVNLIQICKAGG